MTLAAAPQRLFDDAGLPQFGVWKGYGPAGAPEQFNLWREGRLNPLFTEKRWQFIGALSPQAILGMAVVDVGYLGTGWAYLFDRESGKTFEWEAKSLLARNVLAERDPVAGRWRFSTGGEAGDKIDLGAAVNRGVREATLRMHGRAGTIEGALTMEDDGGSVFGYLGDVPGGRFNLAYKNAGMVITGSVDLNGKTYLFSRGDSRGVLDWTWGCPARETFWNWSSCAGVLADGRSIGWNFGTGLNEGLFRENVIWLDGEPQLTGRIGFNYDPQNLTGPWEIRDDEGRISLAFRPDGIRRENLNIVLAVSRFFQPFGRFYGRIRTETGEEIKIDGQPGMCEQHFAKW